MRWSRPDNRLKRASVCPDLTSGATGFVAVAAVIVHFNDTCCDSVTELRSIILKARHLADDYAEQERAAAAVKAWLLARIEKKRRTPSADSVETAPDEPCALERLAA